MAESIEEETTVGLVYRLRKRVDTGAAALLVDTPDLLRLLALVEAADKMAETLPKVRKALRDQHDCGGFGTCWYCEMVKAAEGALAAWHAAPQGGSGR